MTDRKMSDDWPDRLADFLADWEDEHGTIVEDHSLPVLFDWVAALGRQRGALPREPNVVYLEDAWMKCFYRVPVAPTPSSGTSGQVVDGVLTVRAKDIGDLTWRDLLLSLAAYRLPPDVRALMILVYGREPRPFCTIYLSTELLRAFLQLPLADRQAIMSAASSVSVEGAQAAITRAVAAKTAARSPQQPSPAQQNPSGPKLAPSSAVSYNQKSSPAAPASPPGKAPTKLPPGGAEKKQPAGKSETKATVQSGELHRHLKVKPQQTNGDLHPAAYNLQWDQFALDAVAERDVVVVQEITVRGNDNLRGKHNPEAHYFEVIGTIKAGKKVLYQTDTWAYPGEAPKYQLTNETIVQTGLVRAYVDNDALKKALANFQINQRYPWRDKTWRAGKFKSSATFDTTNLTEVGVEAKDAVLTETYTRKGTKGTNKVEYDYDGK
jgi:hypothetical protein